MEKIVYRDLYQFHFLSDVVYSPDGTHAVFTKSNASEEKNGYTSELWLLDPVTGDHRRLTNGGGERRAFWLDDRTVAFSANREKDGDKKSSLWYKIAIDGGEAEKFLEIPEKVSTIKSLDEGRWVIVASRACEGEAEKQENRAEEGKDLLVFDEIPFWANGKGVTNKLRNTVMIFDEADGSCTPVSGQYVHVSGMQISPDRSRIVYYGSEFKDMEPRETCIWLYDIASGETKTLISEEGLSARMPFFMGEDKLFFITTRYEFSGKNPSWHCLDLHTFAVTDLPFHDATPAGSVGTDCNYGGGSAMKFHAGKLYFPMVVWGNAHLVRMAPDGTLETVCATPGSFTCFDIHGDKVLLCAMRGMQLTEVWSLDLTGGEERQLTFFNKDYLDGHQVVTPEYFTFKNRAGIELEGWVLKPTDYEPGKKYPGILEMHGGPKVVFGGLFHHEMQCFANQGYFVFYTNPRGSDGRGEDFANICCNLGYIDFEDFMDFTDEVLRRYPDIDETKVACCGGSYGGFMCNWMIGHTDRFAAAASQRSISNYLSKALCTDIGYLHNMAQLGTNPWEDFDTVWEHSPLKCAPKAKTPTLFIQADEDYRCWMSDAIQMFTALKYNGTDARLVLFHGENHELSRSGKPENRLTRLTEIGSWFEKYLKH